MAKVVIGVDPHERINAVVVLDKGNRKLNHAIHIVAVTQVRSSGSAGNLRGANMRPWARP